jgi:PAS domain S-box-containing protein
LCPLRNSQGEIIGLIVTVRDITERRQAEQALRESEERFRMAAEAAGFGAYVFDVESKTTSWSPQLKAIHGLPADPAIDFNRVMELIHPDDRQRFMDHIANALALCEGAEYEGEFRIVRSDGQVRWVYDRGKMLFEGEAEARRAVRSMGMVMDITERKRAEDRIRASLREKEVLLKEIHHRVKNNLQIISSLLDLQTEYIKDKRALRVFNETQGRVRSMALIHEVLYQSEDLSKIDFVEYIRNLGAYLLQSYGIKSNKVKLNIDVENTSMGIDNAIQCGLIINELVSNSLKHAFPGRKKGEIRISLHLNDNGRDASGRPYTLTVGDNGVGLPKGLDFQNTESLGLEIVTTLVKQLKGTIELDRNGGTAFKIVF